MTVSRIGIFLACVRRHSRSVLEHEPKGSNCCMMPSTHSASSGREPVERAISARDAASYSSSERPPLSTSLRYQSSSVLPIMNSPTESSSSVKPYIRSCQLRCSERLPPEEEMFDMMSFSSSRTLKSMPPDLYSLCCSM